LLNQLASADRLPDLVIFQAGLGYGSLLRAILPSIPIVAYAEWWFQPDLLHWLVGRVEQEDQCLLNLRNSLLGQELLISDLAISATDWQYSQFPDILKPRIHIAFDGIDTSFFCPRSLPGSLLLPCEAGGMIEILPHSLLLTYATRGMEPLRGFPEFVSALPKLMDLYPDLQVVIAGRDRQAYSYPAASHGGSWKHACLQPFLGANWLKRVHFCGLLRYEHYRELLQRTDLHCSFSRPYVPSWSLMEAAACGAPLLLNEGPASSGMLPRKAACRTVNLDDPESVLEGLCAGLAQPLTRHNRQSFLPDAYELQHCLSRWIDLLSPWLS
jgi:glycosyltransferase involved in cell wall biosynthesis